MMVAATFVAATVGFVAPAQATPRVTSVVVGPQTGPALTAPTPGSVTFLVTVGKRNQTEFSATNAVLTASGLPTGASASFSQSTLSWTTTDTAAKTSTLTITTGATTPGAITTFTVRAERTTAGSPAGNGDFASNTRTLTVGAVAAQAPTITFGAAPTPTYLGGNFTVSATTNSNGALTYSAVSGPCALLSGATFGSTGAGACTVRASTAATPAYFAGSANQVVTIAKANQTITFNQPPDRFVGDSDFAVPVTASSGLVVSIAATTGSCTIVAGKVQLTTPATLPGSCTLTASQAGNTNYNAAATVPRTFAINAFTGMELYAVAGSTLLPGQAVNTIVWGYSSTNAAVTQPGGPTLTFNQGAPVSIRLRNQLAAPTALLFQGQSLTPDTAGVPAGESKVYTFTASQPGTFIYEAGLLPNAQHQVAMGLYGALIVRPATTLQAYDNPATAYNDEAVLVLSELDPALNGSANPAAFDMRDYAPKYFMINGKAYPGTAPIASAPGNKVLLRYVNAGIRHHSMAVLGLRQNFVAKDASLLPTLSMNVAAETLAPGQTGDAIATVPASLTTASQFAVYDGSLALHNNGADNAFGGMLTFVTAGSGTAVTGPTASGVAMTPNPTNGSVSVALTASIQSATSTVVGAEYFIDAAGANGTGTAMSAPYNAPTATLSTAQLASLTSGNRVIYVHGRDAAGTWGAFSAGVLNLDKAGPLTSGASLTPNPSNGTVSLALHATGNDTATGGSNITAAEYFRGTTPAANVRGTTMTVNAATPVASLDAIITCTPALPCAAGAVNLRSMDAFGNWGGFATITLSVVNTSGAPTTSAVSASPNPNNGTLALNASTPAVRVTATMTSNGSTVSGAEGFIDTVGAVGTGIPFTPSDGLWNSAVETGFVDIPLGTVGALSNGNHTIYVRGKDAVGNWGTTSTTTLTIDKLPPTFTGITLAPNPTGGAANVTLTVNGADGTGSSVAGGEYWINPPTTADPGLGGGTPFSGTAATIPVGALANGTYTVFARIRDAVGNWSTGTNGVRQATLTIAPDAIFSNGFETATAPWGWTSRSTTTTSRLNRAGPAALVGSFGLQAQGDNANYVQYDFGTAANPATATFDARFYFNPRGNTGTNQDIFVARTTGGTTVFRVRYRMNGTQSQVQIQVGTSTTNTTWFNITNAASNRIEVVWQAGTSLALYVNGVLSQTLTTTSINTVGQFRLGSVVSGGNATLEYFDAFSAKRSVSPLIGP